MQFDPTKITENSIDDLTSYEVLAYIAKEFDIKSYLEIGTREGCSAGTIICNNDKKAITQFRDITVAGSSMVEEYLKDCESFKVNFSGTLTLCDTWGDKYGGTARGSDEIVRDLLFNRLGYPNDKVKIITGDSRIEIPKLEESFDLTYVDGDHSYSGAMIDLINIKDKTNKFIVFDDLYHPSHLTLENCFNNFVKEHITDAGIEANIIICGKNNHGTAIVQFL